jgi:PAS domain S-box-containing protein
MPDPQDFHLLGSALVKNRRCAIVYANGAGGIGFWNAGAEALFGHSAADVSGKRVDVIVPEEYRAIGSAWRGSEAWSSIEGVHKNGSRIALEVFLTPVQEDEEVAKGVLAMFRAAA